ncbi:hypothetical protein DFH07DRAFT_824109 [Mycena maculata]|uniref:Uncharacterized protein n=1 Tax=Mycena maculata TaxID=230809 RepID=A0AAD7IYP4_9AGAR|nr:hypothetical protein DFH07DRAFT_824109 [Mycena maculata]
MPYPQDFLNQEPADARAALMTKIPSQLPPYLGGAARSRYLQAERSKPYRVRSRPYCARMQPKRPLSAECRRARVVLGWGAFLKDETLRRPDGTVIRATKGSCPSSPYAKQEPSYDCHPPLWQGPRTEMPHGGLDRCASARDCSMPLWMDCETGRRAAQRRRSNAFIDRPSEEDCEMPDCPPRIDAVASKPKYFPPVYQSEMSDHSCAKAADEMFAMFIDENCMEE